MSGNRNSGDRTGRSSTKSRQAKVAPRSPAAKAAKNQVVVTERVAPLTEVPEMPHSSWADDRAHELWNRLGQRLVDHKLLSELDLDLLELTVHTWRLMELSIEDGDWRGTASTKVLSCLRALGLTRDGRVSGVKEAAEAEAEEGLFAGLLP